MITCLGDVLFSQVGFIERTHVSAAFAADAGCLMNIADCLRRRGSAVQALHLAEILEKT
jgi:hypothetical protein